MTAVPAISVIMGAYNAETYIVQSIQSILDQSFPDFEFIILNDGSTDGTGDIIRDFAAKDARIVMIHQDNIGHANSLNKALTIAKAPLIARMDADDIALADRFKKQFEFLQANPDVAVLGTSMRIIDQHGEIIKDIIYPECAQKGGLAHPTVMMRKDVVQSLNGYRAFFDPAEDYDLWLRIADHHKLKNLPEIHLLYRQHESNLSVSRAVHQALSASIAELAAKERAAGRKDPTVGLNAITMQTLDLFPLNMKEKIKRIARSHKPVLIRLVQKKDDAAIAATFAELAVSYGKTDYKKIKTYLLVGLIQFCLEQNNVQRARYYLVDLIHIAPLRAIGMGWSVICRCVLRSAR